MGDKTQLATIALAARIPAKPVGILAGTTTGMLIADGICIILGVVMCKRIPQRTIKLISAGAFFFFGLMGSYQVASGMLHLEPWLIITLLTVILIITGIAAYLLIKRNKGVKDVNNVVTDYCKVRYSGSKVEKK